ncbi:hypothetical protein NPIL_2271 [Nephila pilipes]|uniref:Uncharacterized protein n=1 Tax=Nephila pilipes TaxID=299642 RepID=A0A8X6UCT9_NEPPI|nr:hypothetical protein NPIL_2271 [Nephila pilipes]
MIKTQPSLLPSETRIITSSYALLLPVSRLSGVTMQDPHDPSPCLVFPITPTTNTAHCALITSAAQHGINTSFGYARHFGWTWVI